jgi:hypothetical protein
MSCPYRILLFWQFGNGGFGIPHPTDLRYQGDLTPLCPETRERIQSRIIEVA